MIKILEGSGRKMKHGSKQDDALSVPEMMKNCTGLSMEECSVLRKPLDKALTHMA